MKICCHSCRRGRQRCLKRQQDPRAFGDKGRLQQDVCIMSCLLCALPRRPPPPSTLQRFPCCCEQVWLRQSAAFFIYKNGKIQRISSQFIPDIFKVHVWKQLRCIIACAGADSDEGSPCLALWVEVCVSGACLAASVSDLCMCSALCSDTVAHSLQDVLIEKT